MKHTNNRNYTSCTTLNLAIQDQYQCLMENMGGEEYVKKFPEVYKRIQNIKSLNSQGKLLDGKTILEINTPARQLVDAVYFPAVHYDAAAKSLTVHYAVSYTEKPTALYMTLKVYDKDGMLLRNRGIDPEKPESFLTGKVELTDLTLTERFGVSLFSMVTSPGKDLSATLLKEEAYNLLDTASPFAERARVDAPKKNTDTPLQDLSKDGRYIRAFYNRYPQNRSEIDVDYVYEGAYDEANQKVSVRLEGGGSIALSTDVKVGSYEEGSDIAIMDFGCGAVKYTSEGASLGIKGKNFSWLFKPEWNAAIDAKYFFAQTKVNLTYRLGFIQIGRLGENVLYLSSLLENDMGYSCRKIRKLQIAVGCVAKGTKVLMADGTEKCVENIECGEQVIGSAAGETGQVTNIWRGRETQMYCIQTALGNTLLLTGSHYICTDSGTKKAEELNLGMSILMADGRFQPLKYLYTLDETTEVYNLSVRLANGSSGCMVCDGMVLMDNEYKEECPPVKLLETPLAESTYLKQLRELMQGRV